MADYIGIQGQIRRNNTRSALLLLAFPLLIFVAVWAFCYFNTPSFYGNSYQFNTANRQFLYSIPWVTVIVLLWFIIAYFFHAKMIEAATGAKPLDRRENKRVYNLVENLCIGQGMTMPKINVIDDDSLNAFASGINKKTYTVTLSKGIIDKLNDEELEAVIAHELMHIRNKDVRLLIVSIIFVGIFAFIAEVLVRQLVYGNRRNRKDSDARVLLIALAVSLVGYLLSVLFKFALSRKREYMADAGAVEMTKNAHALASALRKVSSDPRIEAVQNKEVAQLFIENPREKSNGIGAAISGLFSTHPPIEKRIAILEQF